MATYSPDFRDQKPQRYRVRDSHKRQLIVTILTQLFCARVRHQQCRSEVVTAAERLTREQVRRACDVFIASLNTSPKRRQQRYQREHDRMSDQFENLRNEYFRQSLRAKHQVSGSVQETMELTPTESNPSRKNHRKPPNPAPNWRCPASPPP